MLKNRLTARGTDGAATVEKRLAASISEIARATEYDYLVINDDLSEAVENTVAIIKSARLKTKMNTGIIDGIVNK